MTHKPQRPQPVPTAETRPFWEGAAEGALVLRRCQGCGRLAPPLAPRCPDCLCDTLLAERLSGRVMLKGRTRLHLQPLPGRTGPLTLVECAVFEDPRIVLIALDEQGVTDGALPDAILHLGFSPAEGDAHFAVVLPPEDRA